MERFSVGIRLSLRNVTAKALIMGLVKREENSYGVPLWELGRFPQATKFIFHNSPIAGLNPLHALLRLEGAGPHRLHLSGTLSTGFLPGWAGGQPWRRQGDGRKGLPTWPRTETLAALVSPVASPLLTPPVDAALPGRPGSLW